MNPEDSPDDVDYIAAHRALASWRACGCPGCTTAAQALQDNLDAVTSSE